MMDKWLLILLLFMILSSVSAVYARKQDTDKKEQSKDNPSPKLFVHCVTVLSLELNTYNIFLYLPVFVVSMHVLVGVGCNSFDDKTKYDISPAISDELSTMLSSIFTCVISSIMSVILCL